MPSATKTVARGAVESYLRQGIDALQRALDRTEVFDDQVPDTRYIERQLQECLHMIRGCAVECHQVQFSYVDSPALTDPSNN
jgi:hypothetical protein